MAAAAVVRGCRGLGVPLLSFLLLSCVAVLASSAAGTDFVRCQGDRLPGPDGFTKTVEKMPFWLREAFYPLSRGQQLTLRLCSVQCRDWIVETLDAMPGIHREEELVRYLSGIAEGWKNTDGFDVHQEADDIASRDAKLQGRSGGSGAGRKSGALKEAGDGGDGDDEPPTSHPPVVVGPLHQFTLPSLWDVLSEARRAGNDTGLWRLSLSEGDELALTAVRRLDPAETVSLLPVYGHRPTGRPELVQLTFPAGEASLRQLLRTPDELLRTLPGRAAGRLPAPTVTAVSVEHAGDVTVTGALADACADNMTDTELETLVHSLLQQALTPAELAALADTVGRHWPAELSAWSPTHVSVLAAHRCELLAHVPPPALMPLDEDTVDDLVRKCQSVWPTAAAGGGSPLGPYVRLWLQKALGPRGALGGWSPEAVSELAPLLVGALPEELEQMGERRQLAAGVALSLAGLDRVQAQPVIARQLAAAHNLTAAGTLYELLRHLQPQHVRQLGRLRHQLLQLSPWLMDDRQESGQYATHLQFRLMLDPQLRRPNVSAEELARLGPFFYTLPLVEVFSRVVEQRLKLTPAQLAGISSSRLESMTCRLLMSMFMLTGDRLCPGCLRGVPAELLGCLTDGSLTQLRLRGLLDADAVAQLVPAADHMLAGKRAELLEAVRRLLRRSGGDDSGGAVVAGSSELWTLAGPTDMPLLVPAVISRMKELALHTDSAELQRAAAEYPRPLLGQVLAYYLGQREDGLWSTESLLGRRPGRRRPPHGPWLYLAGLDCADVAAVTPLDLPAIAEAYERRLQAAGDPHVPLALCVCLQRRLVLYLQVRHAMQRSLNALDARRLSPSALEDAPLHRMSVSDVRAMPACVLLLMPRHYLLSLSREARMTSWLKIGRLTWPHVATHLSVQQNAPQFRWVARQMLHDLNVTNATQLTFEHVAQLNQLLHFVDEDVISRIAPEAFREWIYTLRSASERLVCRPHRAWAQLVSRAFGPAAEWTMSTPYYLGGWIFAVNATERGRISREHLRLSVDNHNAALFQTLPDVIGRRSGRAVTFLEACRDLNDTAIDLRPLFEASRLAGVVGYPKPRARRSASPSQVSPGDLRRLGQDLMIAVRGSRVADRVRSRAEVLVEELVASLGDSSAPDEPEPAPFEFVTSASDRLSCDDLRAAGPAAAAVRPHELAQLAGSDLHGLWSCLNALGRLHWPLGGRSVAEVWRLVREANGERLLPDNLVHLGGLVAALSPDELRQVRVAAPGQPLSTDALSVLGSVDWRPDQLAVLVNSTLGVTEDPRTSRIRLYAEPQTVTALGSLLCGFSPGQLRQLFNGSRPHLYRDTAAAVGRLGACPHDRVVETLAALAVETIGPTSGWTQLTVAAVGAATAGLRRWQFETLPAEALRGLTPVAARRAAANVLATALSADQLRQLTPQSARELLAQPGLDTRQRDALQVALHGRRSVRAAPDPPPETATSPATTDAPDAPDATDAPDAADTTDEPQAEPEPHHHHPDPDPDSPGHRHEDGDSEPAADDQPRINSGGADPEPSSPEEEKQEPDSQGVTQERANSTAPARFGAGSALWLTALILAVPAA